MAPDLDGAGEQVERLRLTGTSSRALVNIMLFIRSSNDDYVNEQIESIRESFDRDMLGQGSDSVLQVRLLVPFVSV